MNGRVVFMDAKNIAVHRGNCIYILDAANHSQLDSFEISPRMNSWRYSEFWQRLLRYGVSSYHLIDGMGFLVSDKTIMFRELGESAKIIAPVVGSRPLVTCTDGESLIYGEYGANFAREPMSIRSISRDGYVSVLQTFQGIRHIHAVKFLSKGRLLVTTGDSDSESKLLELSTITGSVVTIGGGDQTWRIVEPVVVNDDLYYATDIPDKTNFLMKLSLVSGAREKLLRLDGPVFYLKHCLGRLIFGTVSEPSKSATNQAALYQFSISTGLHSKINFIKDKMPSKQFQYGQVLLPDFGADFSGVGFWYYPRAVFGGGKSYYSQFIEN